MKINAFVLILITGLFLVVMVIAQTPSSGGNNTTEIQPATNQTTPPALSVVNNSSSGQYVQGELLVRFNPEAFPTNGSREAFEMQTNAAIGAFMITDFTSQGITGLELVRLPQGMTTQEGIAYYESIPTVLYAEVNAVYSIENATNTSISNTQPARNTTTAGGLFVRYNSTAFVTQNDLMIYANATNKAINATVITDYTPYGLPGLELVSLQPPMTIDQGIAYYRNVTNVLYAEPNIQYSAANSTTTNTTHSG